MKPIATVGVVGAGTMGSAIAQHFVMKGLSVILVDQQQEAGVVVGHGEGVGIRFVGRCADGHGDRRSRSAYRQATLCDARSARCFNEHAVRYGGGTLLGIAGSCRLSVGVELQSAGLD